MRLLPLACAAVICTFSFHAQVADGPDAEVAGIPANYTEAKVGEYKLPDPLTLANGPPVNDAKTWFESRRPEIVRLFERNQYGRAPANHENVSFEVVEKAAPAFEGKASRRQVTIHFSKDKSGSKADLLIYLPPGTTTPVPLLLNISFTANSNTVDDPGVKEGQIWNRERQRVPASSRRRFGRLNVLPTLERGFGIATIYYGDIDPDFDGGLPHGIRSLYLKPGQTEPAPDEWGSIAAWG